MALAARTYRKLVLRPDLGDIERIESKLRWVGFFWLHDLDVRSPGDRLPFLDRSPKIAFRVVWILATVLQGFVGAKLLLAVVRKEVVFDVHKLATLVHPRACSFFSQCRPKYPSLPLEGVAAIAMLVSPSNWRAVVAEEHQPSVVTGNSQSSISRSKTGLRTLQVNWQASQRVSYGQGRNSAGCGSGSE
jgi:hypothetical protein